MTEEIIIECAFYKDGVCASPINKTCEYCKNIDVSKCYHKQLIRLEQENKELKEEIKHWQMEHREGCSKRDWAYEQAKKKSNKYKQALEEIQKAIKSYDLSVDNGVSVDTLYTIRKIINEVLE